MAQSLDRMEPMTQPIINNSPPDVSQPTNHGVVGESAIPEVPEPNNKVENRDSPVKKSARGVNESEHEQESHLPAAKSGSNDFVNHHFDRTQTVPYTDGCATIKNTTNSITASRIAGFYSRVDRYGFFLEVCMGWRGFKLLPVKPVPHRPCSPSIHLPGSASLQLAPDNIYQFADSSCLCYHEIKFDDWCLRSYVANLGAFITVMMVAVDPFFQQLIQYYGCLQPITAPATISRTNNYTVGGNRTQLLFSEPGSAMAKAIYSGALEPPSTEAATIAYNCPTGNCKFPSSLDTSAFFLSLDGGIFQNSSEQLKRSVLSETIISTTPLKKTNASSIEVTVSPDMSWSLATDFIITNGQSRECLITESPSENATVAISSNYTLQIGQDPEDTATRWYEPDCVWVLGTTSGSAINQLLSHMFDASLLGSTTENTASTQGDTWVKQFYHEGTVNITTASQYFEGIASIVTGLMRQHGDTPESGYAEGVQLAMQTCIDVQWPCYLEGIRKDRDVQGRVEVFFLSSNVPAHPNGGRGSGRNY
ncbi:hypothetical protein G7054_g4372 [Neopestalotiopsis clavispora]|nr:hypothetical protein G7054_g4372 [Neopestalotiopsis clavispora]